MAALSRMAADIHKKISIMPGDTIILSSNPIPGNEKAVSNIINELSEKGANVIFQDTHVSGHACQEELKLIYSLVKPKYAIPVHGEYRHLKANAGIARMEETAVFSRTWPLFSSVIGLLRFRRIQLSNRQPIRLCDRLIFFSMVSCTSFF